MPRIKLFSALLIGFISAAALSSAHARLLVTNVIVADGNDTFSSSMAGGSASEASKVNNSYTLPLDMNPLLLLGGVSSECKKTWGKAADPLSPIYYGLGIGMDIIGEIPGLGTAAKWIGKAIGYIKNFPSTGSVSNVTVYDCIIAYTDQVQQSMSFRCSVSSTSSQHFLTRLHSLDALTFTSSDHNMNGLLLLCHRPNMTIDA